MALKILEINAVCQSGSTGRNMVEIAEFLEEKQIECWIAHSSNRHYKNEYIIGSSRYNKLHALLSRITGWQEIYSVIPTLQLGYFIWKNNFDVVNLNNIHSNYLSFPLLMKLLHKWDIPVVLTLHDCWFYTGKCTHYTRDNCFAWKSSCGHCPRLKKDIPSFCFDFTKHMLKQKEKLYQTAAEKLYVVGVSKWISGEAEKSILGCAAKITTIYNWVDTNLFRPLENTQSLREKYGIPSEKRVLLGVAAGWTEDKGLSDFVRLSDMLPDCYEILLIGDNTSGFHNRSNIKIIGKTDSIEQLAEYYNLADCFLSLSEEESFGKVVAEALACGTPVIVYNSTASPELVGEGCGYVVEKHDFSALLNAIESIFLQSPELYRITCRNFALTNFEKNENIQKYFELYCVAVEQARKNKGCI